MTKQQKIAAARRDDGMARAVEHADDASHAWSDRAYGFLLLFAGRNKNKTYLMEEVRAFAYANGCDAPPDERAWGAVTVRAVKNGIIRKVGYALAASSNCSPKPLWRTIK